MSRATPSVVVALLAFAVAGCGWKTYVDPAAAGPDYALQGEYVSSDAPVAAQVVALGDGAFRAVFLEADCRARGWDGETRVVVEAFREGNRIDFVGAWQAALEGGRIVGETGRGEAFTLERVVRKSPTDGLAPPPGAVVLFAGEDTSALAEGELAEDGWLGVPVQSRDAFGDMQLHLEFRTPFMPTATGQMRGNSGVYLQNRYEVQVLDSFGLRGEDNECGGIYQVARPRVNMAFPPLQWQTYDLEFTAARFDEAGEKTANARLTVRHNGVVIHDDIEIPGKTGGGDAEGPSPGPLHLQDHFNPVRYRNVWVVRRDA